MAKQSQDRPRHEPAEEPCGFGPHDRKPWQILPGNKNPTRKQMLATFGGALALGAIAGGSAAGIFALSAAQSEDGQIHQLQREVRQLEHPGRGVGR
jgi:hypothetical protein